MKGTNVYSLLTENRGSYDYFKYIRATLKNAGNIIMERETPPDPLKDLRMRRSPLGRSLIKRKDAPPNLVDRLLLTLDSYQEKSHDIIKNAIWAAYEVKDPYILVVTPIEDWEKLVGSITIPENIDVQKDDVTFEPTPSLKAQLENLEVTDHRT